MGRDQAITSPIQGMPKVVSRQRIGSYALGKPLPMPEAVLGHEALIRKQHRWSRFNMDLKKP